MISVRKGADLNWAAIAIGGIVIVLVLLAVFSNVLIKGVTNSSEQTTSECAKLENEEECTSLKTENWIGEQKNKCFWDEQEETCGKQVN